MRVDGTNCPGGAEETENIALLPYAGNVGCAEMAPFEQVSADKNTGVLLQGLVVDSLQLCVRHIAAHVDRKIGYLVDREYRRSRGVRHFDPEEVGVLDFVQYESRPQIFFIGSDLNVIELNALYVPHVESV